MPRGGDYIDSARGGSRLAARACSSGIISTVGALECEVSMVGRQQQAKGGGKKRASECRRGASSW